MPLLGRLERALERLAEGSAERVFGGSLDLVAVGQELYNAAAETSRRVGKESAAPDAYEVHLAFADYGGLLDVVDALQERYEGALWHRLREAGYVVAAVPRVLLRSREGVQGGRFRVAARFTSRQPTCLLRELATDGRAHRLALPAAIGRGEDADVVLEGQGVSRRHAAIVWDRNHFSVVDLGSKNGTFVNGHRLSRGTIEPGDTLLVGERALRLGLDTDASGG
jgi:hypothetical protein